jgi:ATP-dependent Clp protease ATP-binding subunit ClpC
MSRLRKLFRPEFLNRVDAVVVFRSLSHDDIREIVRLEIDKLRDRVLENGFDLRLSETAQEWLAERGYSPEYGARPLRRLIQQEIETRMSDALLSGKYRVGDVILVDCADDEIVLKPAEEPEMVVEL